MTSVALTLKENMKVADRLRDVVPRSPKQSVGQRRALEGA